jgi:hypothetical protein
MNRELLNKLALQGGNVALVCNYAQKLRDENIILTIRLNKLKKDIQKLQNYKLEL